MSVKSMVLGPVETNVYFLINDETKETLLFDPAYAGERIQRYLEDNGLILKAIFLTHGHFDHITGVSSVREALKVPVYAAKSEERLLLDGELNESLEGYGYSVTVKPDRLLSDGEETDIAGMKIRMIETPGHTEGSCCYYHEDGKALFSGDTLFAGSVGRTDLPTGSMKQLISSIENKLMLLPDDVDVYPGHGGFTTIGYERKWNPFFGFDS
ncbi:MAG: MBL fold metallo-hydrolase [Lachnospiraceae bacterium]|nr:MBL fold metallo-hydrolase [Lachnospiraceae bacterium]